MPQYRYQARQASGQVQAGVLAADSAAAAAALLRSQGAHVLQLVPVGAGGAQLGSKLKALNVSSGPSQRDILDFIVGYGDTTVFLHDKLYGVRDGRVEVVWDIQGRGKLR